MKSISKLNFMYWLLIICANTMGETAGDLISQTFHLGYASSTVLLLFLLFVAVIVSLRTQRAQTFLYWTVITLSSTAGTTIADFLSRTLIHLQFGMSENEGYSISTLVLALSLALIYWRWKSYSKRQGNTENSTAADVLYWTAILTSSTLGTAVGDLLAHNTPLGFDGGTILLSVLLFILIVLVYTIQLSKQFSYWAAIVLTHPIGATMGDYMTKAEGMNLGNVDATWILVAVLSLVASANYVYAKRRTAEI
jgi:uncharacterized membrane-anchored protein